MTSQANIQFNRAVLGKEYRAASRRISREMIQSYARAVGETNPRYLGGEKGTGQARGSIVAPPALLVTFIDNWEPPDLDLKFDGTLYLAGYWIEPVAPVGPGDELTITLRVRDVYTKTGRSGPMVFLRKEAVYTNQDGVIVARVGASSVWRK